MEELSLRFLPFPHVYRGERRPGLNRDWPDRCSKCDRQCEDSDQSGVQLCSYGVNYLRVDEDLLIAGVVARDYPSSSHAYRKMRGKLSRQLTTVGELDSVLRVRTDLDAELAKEVERRKQAVIEDYRRTDGFREDVIAGLRPDVQRALAQVHDYRQLITQIIQNVNVILYSEHPGIPLDESLRRASHEIRAIYWSARLMESKLEAALYLMYPERINDARQQTSFRLHGLVTKYTRIYQRSIEEKDLQVKTIGTSYGNIFANQDAAGVIPHTFLDNAVKYAPRGTTISISFSETTDAIRLDVSSFGPKITPSERPRIFDIFFRGEAAEKRVMEGTGFGLGLAQHVASAIGATLSVDQQSEAGGFGSYMTTFSAVFRKDRGVRAER
jgi:signal transduction histidine kinase